MRKTTTTTSTMMMMPLVFLMMMTNVGVVQAGPLRVSATGSLNGFDVGGPDPICYESSLMASAFATTNPGGGGDNESDMTNNNNIMAPTAANSSSLFSLIESGGAKDALLTALETSLSNPEVATRHLVVEPECTVGTQLRLRPSWRTLQGRDGISCYMNTLLRHRVNLQLNVTALLERNDQMHMIDKEQAVFVRIVMCDVLGRGNCNPVDFFVKDWLFELNETDKKQKGFPRPPPTTTTTLEQEQAMGNVMFTADGSSVQLDGTSSTPELVTDVFFDIQTENGSDNNNMMMEGDTPQGMGEDMSQGNMMMQGMGEDMSQGNMMMMSPRVPAITMQRDMYRKVLFTAWFQPTHTTSRDETGALWWNVSNFDLDLIIPLGAADDGSQYRVVVHAMFVALDHNQTFRLDAANVSATPIVTIRNEPRILQVSSNLLTFVLALMGLYGLVSLALIAFFVYFRNHAVVRLAQGSFLVVIVVAALVGTVFLFTFLPEHDWYCRAKGPLVLFPFSFVGAVLVARLWRVQTTLANAMNFGRSTTTSSSSGLPDDDDELDRSSTSSSVRGCQRCNPIQGLMAMLTFLARFHPVRFTEACCRSCRRCLMGNNNNDDDDDNNNNHPHHKNQHLALKLRHSIRQAATVRETIQLIFFLSFPQLILQILSLFFVENQLELFLSESERTGRYFCTPDTQWVQFVGLVLAIVNYSLAILVAYGGRHLPSAFNEKEAIFHTACLTAILLFVKIVILEVTNDPGTPPDSEFFLSCTTLLGSSTAMIFTLVLPKVYRVVSGEKVVVGNLLRSLDGGSDATSMHSSSVTEMLDPLDVRSSSVSQFGASSSTSFRHSRIMSSSSRMMSSSSQVLLAGSPINLQKDDPIPREIEGQLHQLYSFLGDVTSTCAQGRTMSSRSWTKLRRHIARLKMDVDRVKLNWVDESDEFKAPSQQQPQEEQPPHRHKSLRASSVKPPALIREEPSLTEDGDDPIVVLLTDPAATPTQQQQQQQEDVETGGAAAVETSSGSGDENNNNNPRRVLLQDDDEMAKGAESSTVTGNTELFLEETGNSDQPPPPNSNQQQ